MGPTTSDTLTGQVVAGHYQLEAMLGEGGMGAVYRATSPDGDTVAVKILHREILEEEVIARFLREAKVVRTVESPHVIPILDAGRDEAHDAPFIVMPLLEGPDIRSLMQRLGPLHPRTAVRIALQAAEGLSAAHRAGIIHRDVKPANLLLDFSNDDVSVRVCDFGVAKRLDDAEQITKSGSQVGSPLYMSPEQLRSSKHVDARTDIWSLGITLYEMLGGRAPFGDIDSVGEIFMAIPTRDAPALVGLAPWIPAGLSRAVHRALERDAKARWSSMDAFAEALERYSAGDRRLTQSMLTGVPDDLREGSSEGLAETAVDMRGRDGDPMIGRTLDGRFRVLELIGQGGMGAVYEVEADDGSKFAAKVITSSGVGDTNAVKRLLREARAASDIESPHVLRMLETGADSRLGAQFILMERLEGLDLGALLQREGALQPQTAVRIFIQAARGVAAAHARGVVHRDIKPANLFLHSEPGSDNVTIKVCDFGIAKLADTDQTQDLTCTGGMIGSPLYMSPEQARNAKHVDLRTDVWSLCVTLWQALAGRHLWEGPTALGEIILAICHDHIAELTRVAPWVDAELAAIVHKGLVRDPDGRWQSLEEMISALEPFSGGSLGIESGDLEGIGREPSHVDLAPPSSPPDSAADPTVAATSLERTASRGTALPRRAALGMGAIAIAIVAGVLVSRRHAPAPRARAQTVQKHQGTAKAAASRLLLSIHPADATVTINGTPTEVRDGHVAVVGAPGDSFEIVAKSGNAEKRVRAFITREHALEPDHIRVPLPAVEKPEPREPNHARPRRTPHRKARRARLEKPAAAAPHSTASQPAPTATQKPTPQVKATDKW